MTRSSLPGKKSEVEMMRERCLHVLSELQNGTEDEADFFLSRLGMRPRGHTREPSSSRPRPSFTGLSETIFLEHEKIHFAKSAMDFELAWRRALERRRLREEAMQVPGIGELSLQQALWTLPSAMDIPNKTRVCFSHFPASERDYGTYKLYWIDERGKRHHGYELDARKEWMHTEHTSLGHAFALYYYCKSLALEKEVLVCSYRILALLASPQMHHVRITRSSIGKKDVRVEMKCALQEARVICELNHALKLPSRADWQIRYSFFVPHKPKFPSHAHHTLYVWGDVSFDEFDSKGHVMTRNAMNQLVPQVMIGHCLCKSNPETLEPEWQVFENWVAQAQYYFQTELGEERGSRA